MQPVAETNEEGAAAAGASKSLAAADLDTAQPASEPDATAPRRAFLEHAAIAAGPPAAATAAAPAQKPADMRQPASRVQASASNAGQRQNQAVGSAKASVETARAQCSSAGAQELASIPSTACQTVQGEMAPAAAQAPSDAIACRGKPMGLSRHQMSGIRRVAMLFSRPTGMGTDNIVAATRGHQIVQFARHSDADAEQPKVKLIPKMATTRRAAM